MDPDGRFDLSSDDPKSAQRSGYARRSDSSRWGLQATAAVSAVGTQISKLCMNEAVRRAMLCGERCCAESDAVRRAMLCMIDVRGSMLEDRCWRRMSRIKMLRAVEFIAAF